MIYRIPTVAGMTLQKPAALNDLPNSGRRRNDVTKAIGIK
jgi:hypothetical protein